MEQDFELRPENGLDDLPSAPPKPDFISAAKVPRQAVSIPKRLSETKNQDQRDSLLAYSGITGKRVD